MSKYAKGLKAVSTPKSLDRAQAAITKILANPSAAPAAIDKANALQLIVTNYKNAVTAFNDSDTIVVTAAATNVNGALTDFNNAYLAFKSIAHGMFKIGVLSTVQFQDLGL